ncbi:phosphotransferase [Blastococcus haudaquaticus]|uniref:O-antigen chain-terminating methyltransferase n=1 Tax=Blastococcus haudaquaticus TaxID=1938745 RepID=A0A286GE04_9ACTN|nr:methyltransferase domain-containing protein [Blastococcus haudaquaticus]SOD93753.1 O-antigen chain-terminating methyltransferase [Blastococcus haudaquaticus]
MRKQLRAAIARLAPEAIDGVQNLQGLPDRLDRIDEDLSGLSELVRQVDLRVNHFQQFDFRLQKLRSLAAQVEPYQPAYGLPGVIAEPARDSVDRCRAIENHFGGRVRGKRLLDVGSSLGFVCYWFADRGMVTEGWEGNPANAEVAQLIGELNGVPSRIRTQLFDADSVATIGPGQFDVVTLLSVLHHVVYHQGLEQTQVLMRDLLQRVPVLVLELARKGEDPDLFWDASLPEDELDIFALVRDEVEIVQLGMFGTHLSDKARPLYVVSRKERVSVNDREYAVTSSRAEAYPGSAAVVDHESRRYMWGDGVFIKQYRLAERTSANARLITHEISALIGIQHLSRAPRLIDYEVSGDVATVVYGRVAGDLLETGAPLPAEQIDAIVGEILAALRELHGEGLFHNDVRSWNILWDGTTARLIDYADTSSTDFDGDLVSVLWLVHALTTGTREPTEQGKSQLPPREALDPRFHELYDQVAGGIRRATELAQ